MNEATYTKLLGYVTEVIHETDATKLNELIHSGWFV
jgi:hypothetical protein